MHIFSFFIRKFIFKLFSNTIIIISILYFLNNKKIYRIYIKFKQSLIQPLIVLRQTLYRSVNSYRFAFLAIQKLNLGLILYTSKWRPIQEIPGKWVFMVTNSFVKLNTLMEEEILLVFFRSHSEFREIPELDSESIYL